MFVSTGVMIIAALIAGAVVGMAVAALESRHTSLDFDRF